MRISPNSITTQVGDRRHAHRGGGPQRHRPAPSRTPQMDHRHRDGGQQGHQKSAGQEDGSSFQPLQDLVLVQAVVAAVDRGDDGERYSQCGDSAPRCRSRSGREARDCVRARVDPIFARQQNRHRRSLLCAERDQNEEHAGLHQIQADQLLHQVVMGDRDVADPTGTGRRRRQSSAAAACRRAAQSWAPPFSVE